ncbi:uncharacterized protein LACBIDRAFT_316271 [Laccaria bicolor S238N-H82]|uniref:Predicted protein n=1 Tax=Laccaria bicolor (strain S238N-H82 / ATCC MYA-4686) TaxID=486041 RepID=B0E0L2_LACBS|nr:uncharacterized protein LACBIDRAFT_316271 [Laccaria bicolor S238N-H82]EDQ99605.1 predicted protein [Laccaria bicolor S238N-H82]|eukprot:XP_001889716.1 predicted protein [Laccaria bicolor S238N-H82]
MNYTTKTKARRPRRRPQRVHDDDREPRPQRIHANAFTTTPTHRQPRTQPCNCDHAHDCSSRPPSQLHGIAAACTGSSSGSVPSSSSDWMDVGEKSPN